MITQVDMSIVGVFAVADGQKPFPEEPDDDAGSVGMSGFELGPVAWGASFFGQLNTTCHICSQHHMEVS